MLQLKNKQREERYLVIEDIPGADPEHYEGAGSWTRDEAMRIFDEFVSSTPYTFEPHSGARIKVISVSEWARRGAR